MGVLLVLGLGWAWAAEPEAPVHHTEAWVVQTPDGLGRRLDPSGLARVDGQLLVVSDKSDYPDIYVLEPGPNRIATMRTWRKVDLPGAGTDTEGLAACGDHLFVVVEGRNQVLQFDRGGRVLPLDLGGVGTVIPSPVTWLNAGLEGIACAPDGRMWVAKEREPRAIFRIAPATGKATGVWEERARTDRPVDHNGTAVWPSWSDLQFLDGHLYALHRDARAVVRLDPTTGTQTGLMRLDLDEEALYPKTKPYGMAEGLWVEDDAVWIVLDNNSDELGAGPRSGEPAPMLFRYPRPPGF
jgi:hypothetical protein